MLNYTTEDIRKIKIGDSLTIKVSPLKQINSIRTIISRLNTLEPELGKIFSSETDIVEETITIKANKR
ncbi:MAG TPA: hypothetical protein VFD00_00730 [Thermoclostridium sp.]|nr:hypothetical protein [Thermoclostridium sp.]